MFGHPEGRRPLHITFDEPRACREAGKNHSQHLPPVPLRMPEAWCYLAENSGSPPTRVSVEEQGLGKGRPGLQSFGHLDKAGLPKPDRLQGNTEVPLTLCDPRQPTDLSEPPLTYLKGGNIQTLVTKPLVPWPP